MAYNNTFPMGYQPMYYQQPAAQNTGGIIWVQGEAGAKSYLVAPNNTVQLWDSENQVIYLKSADASGMPSMKILEYKIRNNNQPAVAVFISQVGEAIGIQNVDTVVLVLNSVGTLIGALIGASTYQYRKENILYSEPRNEDVE